MIYKNSVDFNKPDPLKPNASFALPANFRLIIDGQKYQNAMFSVQRVALPTISAQPAPNNLPQRNIGFTPDKLTYEDLEISFLIDENFTNYREIHDWIYGLVNENDEPAIPKYRDITLVGLSSHNNPIVEFKFVNTFPISLSSLQFDSTSSDAEYLIGNVTFHYSYFRIT
jgi:hypothetical protein